MSGIPYEVPKEWHDSLDELKVRVHSYPEDPEDRAIREYDERLAAMSLEAQEKLRNFVFGGELIIAIDEATDDPD